MALDESAIVIADTDGIISFWSKGAEDSFGHSAASAVGRSLDLIVPVEFREAHWTGFRRAVVSGSAGAEGQANLFPVLCADQEVKNVSGKLKLLRRDDGTVLGCMVIFD